MYPLLAVCWLSTFLLQAKGTTATGDAGPSNPPHTPQFAKHIPHVLAGAISVGSVVAARASNCTSTPGLQSIHEGWCAANNMTMLEGDTKKFRCDLCRQTTFCNFYSAKRHVHVQHQPRQKRARSLRGRPCDNTPSLLNEENQQTMDIDVQDMEDHAEGTPSLVARTLVYPMDESDLDDGAFCNGDVFAPYQEDQLCDGSLLPADADDFSDEEESSGLPSDEEAQDGLPGDVLPDNDNVEGLLQEQCNGGANSDNDSGVEGEDSIKPKRNRKYICTRKTAKFYIDRRHDLLHPAGNQTVLGSTYMWCDWKDKNNVHDMAFDEICRAQAELMLPDGNLFPPSFYMMKQVLGYVAADQFEGHICDNCAHVHPKLDKEKWAADHTCNTCGAKRFKMGRNKRLTPVKRYWDFGIESILRTWFATPSTSEVLGKERDFDDAATFLGSPYGKMLDTMCNKKFSGPGEKEMALYLSIGTTPTST